MALPSDSRSKFFVLYQPYLYFPILAFARLAWCQQSVAWALPDHIPLPFLSNTRSKESRSHRASENITNQSVELATLFLHWFLYIAAMVRWLGVGWNMCLYFLVSQGTCGLLLAIVFSLNHNGMPIFRQEEVVDMDFFTKQVLTSRDVEPTMFNTWFTGLWKLQCKLNGLGGLNFQVEHHLFPSLPRHNFHHVQPLVQRLCLLHNVPYHMTSFVDGTIEVLQQLHRVASAATKIVS